MAGMHTSRQLEWSVDGGGGGGDGAGLEVGHRLTGEMTTSPST